MKKVLSYVIPALLCAAAVAVIFAGYFQYEYKANMSNGIAAPIGVSMCFIAFSCAEIVFIHTKKFNAAIVVSIVKFALLFIGIITVFKHTLTGLGFMLVFGLAIPIFLPVAMAALAIRALIFVALIIIYVGIIAEPIILALNRPPKQKPAENAV